MSVNDEQHENRVSRQRRSMCGAPSKQQTQRSFLRVLECLFLVIGAGLIGVYLVAGIHGQALSRLALSRFTSGTVMSEAADPSRNSKLRILGYADQRQI